MTDSATSEQNPTVISGPNRAFSFWALIFFNIMDSIRETQKENHQEWVILINPFEQAVIIQGSSLDSYLQSLAENEASKYIMHIEKIKSDKNKNKRSREYTISQNAMSACILPWLKLHSTCPVCKYRMPVEERDKGSSGVEGEGGGEGDFRDSGEAERESDGGNSRERRV
ncbi:hypothetical protein AMTRI_Chr12g271560 [Amborella trichopoda]